jgi:hypothetical protein
MKFKKLSIFILLLFTVITGCNVSTNWEYKVLTYDANKFQAPDKGYTESDDFFKRTISSTSIIPSENSLNEFGKDGWELVSSHLEMETVYPNLLASGSGVAGLQPNIRPQQLVIILKRPLKKK